MGRIVFILGFIIVALIPSFVKASQKRQSLPTREKKKESSAMPHKHETKHYTATCDASKLPKGYILLNGEPVRVADLDEK